MAINILNPTFIYNGSTFNNWTIGSNGAWGPLNIAPDNHGVFGLYSIPGDDSISQTGVFTDFDSGTLHKVKLVISFNTNTGTATNVNILFGSVTAFTITSATTVGTHYFTASAATNSTLSININGGFIGITDLSLADYEILSQPEEVQPVYNPMYFNVSSIRTNQPNYKYVFQIFTGTTTTGTPIFIDRLLPRPVLANCLFNPNRVLESYVSYDPNIQNITSGTTSRDNIVNYIIDFGEEYGSLTTGTTTYSGLTTESGYTFNGVLQYEQLPNWDYTQYAIGSTSSLFLTRQPRTGIFIKNATDRGTLSFLQIDTLAPRFVVQVFHSSGGSTTTKFLNLAYSGSSPDNHVNHLPSGIWNINNIPNSFRIGGGTAPYIDINNDTSYQIWVENSGGTRISEQITYIIDSYCTKYQTVRLQFLNSLGGFDYANFDLVSRKTINVTRGTYKKNLPYNYTVGYREKTVIDIDGNYTYSITSNWIDNNQSIWMEELIKSPEVYVINDDGSALPIIIDDNSVEILKSINNKLMNYSFNYELAYKINGQRG